MLTEKQRRHFGQLRQSYGAAYNDGQRGAWGGYTGRGHWENVARWERTAETIVDGWHPRSVLDLGCGRGALIHALRRRGVVAWGCDIADVRAPFAVVANACELPFRGEFDCVLALDIIEHIPADCQRPLWRELSRVVGRAILVTVPTERPRFVRFMDDGIFNHYLTLCPPEWTELFSEHGFTVTQRGEQLARLGEPFNHGDRNYPFVLVRRNGHA